MARYKEQIRRQERIRRFYEIVGANLDNATVVLNIAYRDTRDLSAIIGGVENKVNTVKGSALKPEKPVTISISESERRVGEGRELGKQELLARPVSELPKELPSGVQVAWATRNDQHGEDCAMEIINEDGDLHGIVVCDGVTNANGGLASVSIAKAVQMGFRRVHSSENLGVLRSQMDLLVREASRQLGLEARTKGMPETATTLLLAFADRRGFYVYYIGDGTVRQYSEDAYSVGDYLMTYERGGALGGYISSKGIVSRPTFLFVDSQVTQGSFLVLATDGAELANPQNHITLGTMLRDDCASGRKTLRDVLEAYLDGVHDRIDDATVGTIWNRQPSTDSGSI